ncbi:MAG: hypothetical protein LWW93_17975, partial [Hyphomicrobiales bacterium]|nr:hypothetical protein [Hyphomicrobiales bacterium]
RSVPMLPDPMIAHLTLDMISPSRSCRGEPHVRHFGKLQTSTIRSPLDERRRYSMYCERISDFGSGRNSSHPFYSPNLLLV